MGYGVWLHGEAVAAGIVMATKVSETQGWITPELTQRIIGIVTRAQLPIDLSNERAVQVIGAAQYARILATLTPERFLELMSKDKKVADGKLSLVLLQNRLGGCVITDSFDPAVVEEIVRDFIAKATAKA